MIRTQVYLPKSLYRHVQLLAQKENKPAAELVRELLSESLARKTANIGQALRAIGKIGGKGPADLSTNIDKYLYEP